MTDLYDQRDGPRDECGVFGVYGPGLDVSRLAYFALYALQHRGQESAGIAVAQDRSIMTLRDQGLVSQVFDEHKLRSLQGDMAIGHVRYSTTGSSAWENAQPVWRSDRREAALAHNGNLVNAVELHSELREQGVSFRSTSDSEIIAALLSGHPAERIQDAVAAVMPRLHGAFSTVVMTKDAVVAFRDPAGLRPLALGMVGDRYCVASESCAFDIIGGTLLREVLPGEMVTLDQHGLSVRQVVEGERKAFCIFEYIYFARPDSVVGGRTVYDVRKAMGAQLAKEAAADADVIVPVPDSGVPAALGFAQASGIPYELGIIRNHYVGRTFIEPTQQIRQLGVRLKHSANRAVVNGKRIVLVDDSIVRGTTSSKIVKMMRDAGATEVHFRISSPPITHPDYYGIDTPERDKLLAATHTLEEMRQFIGADSLAFLSVEGIYKSMGYEARDPVRPQFTDHCFTGEYPTGLTDQTGQQAAPRQLSLLAEAG
jgi:amidophosphoribosyltransferase